MHQSIRLIAAVNLLLVTFPAFSQTDSDLNLECLLEPYMIVNLGTPVPGVLASVLVERGDIVREGAPLARLDERAQRAAVDLSRARAEFANRRVVRNEELYKDDLVSGQERDELITDSQLANLELNERLVQLWRCARSTARSVALLCSEYARRANTCRKPKFSNWLKSIREMSRWLSR